MRHFNYIRISADGSVMSMHIHQFTAMRRRPIFATAGVCVVSLSWHRILADPTFELHEFTDRSRRFVALKCPSSSSPSLSSHQIAVGRWAGECEHEGSLPPRGRINIRLTGGVPEDRWETVRAGIRYQPTTVRRWRVNNRPRAGIVRLSKQQLPHPTTTATRSEATA